MDLVRMAWRMGLGLAVLVATTLPAQAVDATLVADAHVNSALPSVNSGAISNLNVGAGYTALLQSTWACCLRERPLYRCRERCCGCT